jgi:hypothetical protein
MTGIDPRPRGPRVESGAKVDYAPRGDFTRRPDGAGRKADRRGDDVVGAAAGRWLGIGLFLVVAGLGGGLVWYVVTGAHRSAGTGDGIPTILADQTPFKKRPEQTGGLDVPLQDKLVYDRLNPEANQGAVERLLPPPETPIARPAAPADAQPPGPDAEPPASPVPDAAPSPAPLPPAPLPPAPLPPAAAPPSGTDSIGSLLAELGAADKAAASKPSVPKPPAPKPSAEPAPAVAVAAPPAAAPVPAPVEPVPARGGQFRVQIASVPSEDGARAEWNRLRQHFVRELSGLGVSLVRADLGSRGIYYRVQAGPVDDARGAAICATLKSQNIGCMLVHQ